MIRKLKENEIELRVGNITSSGYSLLLYKNARVDMEILDEEFGAMNWQREHKEIKGNVYCGVSIYDKEKNMWITKWDCGAESYSDKEKGEASDAFKRACVNIGIGRELYTAPFIWISGGVEESKGKYVLTQKEKRRLAKFIVGKIDYCNNRISTLEIINKDTKEVVYRFNDDTNIKEEVKKDFVFESGRFKGLTMYEASERGDFNEYIEMLKTFGKFTGKIKEEYELLERPLNLKKEMKEVEVC